MTAEERLATLLADPAWAGSEVAKVCAEFIADQKRLHQRLERISRISDGYQGELMRANRDLAAANQRLAAALDDIRTLSGFIPICSKCKRVRDDGGFWDDVENYLTKHSEAVLGQSICPQCMTGTHGHVAAIALVDTQHEEADAEAKRLAEVLANDAFDGHPLRPEYERLSLGFQKLARRLNKISHISDGFQTQLKHLNTALARASLTDPLTSLPNRRAMIEQLDRATEAARNGRDFAVAMIDIDHFKRVNDSFGHAVGDSALRALAELLARMRREHDFAARWGGEEFLLLLVDSEAGAVRAYCENVRAATEALRIEHNERHLGFTVSIGLAFHERMLSFEDTIRDADRALYAAKSYGRNNVICAEDL
ncbi:MAG TPA: diguanylate cyclase [Xanthomonadaceae bacterium]|jgi:diguanylate cyclase (GGDEF)-like protein|nr:diguanylate cyclase [Xanthomonadaceae bacterium]